MDNRYKKLGKNTILVFVGQAGSSLISLLMLPLYTHWLSTEEYGTVDLMSTYATILLSIVTCCISGAIFIFPKGASNVDKTKYFSSGFLFTLFTVVLFSVFNYFFEYIYKDVSFLKTYSWYTLLLMFSMFLQKYFQQFTRSLENMKVFAATGVVYTIAVALFAIALIPHFHLIGYIYSLILANVISALFSFFFSKSYKFLSLQISGSHLKTLLSYSIPLIPNTIMWWLVNGMNRPMMETYLGVSAIGIFAVANKFPGIINMISNVFSNAWGISMLDEIEKPGFSVFFNKVFKLISVLSFFVAFVIIILSKEIIGIFASEAFLEASHVLPVLVIAAVLDASAGLVGGVFMAIKQSKFFLYSSATGATISLILTFFLIKQLGLIGCALAILVSFLVVFVMRVFFAWKYIKREFSILYYCLLFIVLLLAFFIEESSVFIMYKVEVYFLLLAIILFASKDVLAALFSQIKNMYSRFLS